MKKEQKDMGGILEQEAKKKQMDLLQALDPEHQTNFPYRADDNGNFGELKINLPLIYRGKLKVKKRNKIIFDEKCSDDLKDHLTKRYNSRRNYNPNAIQKFNELIELSNLPKHSPSKKSNLVAIPYKNGQDLAEKLKRNIASYKVGNNSVENHIKFMLKELLRIGEIDKNAYDQYYSKLFI